MGINPDHVHSVGNSPALGNWNTANALALDPSKYTSSNPLWFKAVSFAPASVIQYKVIKIGSSGVVTWEADPNHTYTVPCAAAATVSSSWQG